MTRPRERCDALTRRGHRCAYYKQVVIDIDGRIIEVCRVHHAYYTEWVHELGRVLANQRLIGLRA